MNLIKKIAYSNCLKVIMRLVFGLFYEKKYLRGYFFDEKRLGWYWAYKDLRGRLFGPNKKIPWPVNPNTIVAHAKNLIFDVDNSNIFQTPGCYWQNFDRAIRIGKGSYVAPNVGIITTNHDIKNLKKKSPGRDISIGEDCWIGMNAVILPGVVLGNKTIVGAGAVVTKSFPKGHCVVGGVPAKVIKVIESDEEGALK